MRDFYNGKRVLITGNTGFKGSWMCTLLLEMGAEVYGYALEPETSPAIYEILRLDQKIRTCIADVRNIVSLAQFMEEVQPEIVIHMAAQPIVITGYEKPVYTYDVNVMGTVNVLECARNCSSVKSVLNVTTDKVYRNNEWEWGYRENDILDGYDPYSNSKSCSELVTACYKRSFYDALNLSLSTARAGNVIGGGDFSPSRIVPDCIRAVSENRKIEVRNPNYIRPFQHVLEPVYAYLFISMKQYQDRSKCGNYNIGPEYADCITTGTLADLFCECWEEGASWCTQNSNGPHEANFLRLDCSKMKNEFVWTPSWNVKTAVEKTVEWHKAYLRGCDMFEVTTEQIKEYLELAVK